MPLRWMPTELNVVTFPLALRADFLTSMAISPTEVAAGDARTQGGINDALPETALDVTIDKIGMGAYSHGHVVGDIVDFNIHDRLLSMEPARTVRLWYVFKKNLCTKLADRYKDDRLDGR